MGVRWGGIPLDKEIVTGREAARLCLNGAVDSFWTPSAVLYRASIVRATDDFFPGSAPSADVEACLNCLKHNDLGFVHQILSFERIHDEMITAKTADTLKMDSMVLDRIRILIEFGPEFLTLERARPSAGGAAIRVLRPARGGMFSTSETGNFGSCTRKGSMSSGTPSTTGDS